MKHILITGANSYIGTSFEKYMAQWPDEYQVDTIDMRGDAWREKSFAGYDSVFHVAGIAHINTKKLDKVTQEKYWAVNADLPVEVAKKAKTEGVEHLVFLSSMSIFGKTGSIRNPVTIVSNTIPNPKDIYGRSKLAAEQGLSKLICECFVVCILRPPMIYGPRCKGNYQLLSKASKVIPVFPEFCNRRSMLFIDNLSSYVKRVIDSKVGGVQHPHDAVPVCTSDLMGKIAAAHGHKIRFTRVFNPLLTLLSGRLSLVDKVFGTLTYGVELGVIDDDTCVGFEESILRSESSREI